MKEYHEICGDKNSYTEHPSTLFQTLIENVQEIIAIIDDEGIIRYVSPSAERILGYKPVELIEKNISDLIHPDDLPMALESYESMKGSNAESGHRESRTGEARIRCKDDSWRFLESITIPLDIPPIKGMVITARDITERKQVEEALNYTQTLFRTVMEETPDPIFVKDRTSCFLLANPATLTAMGKSAEQVIGKKDSDIYNDPDAGRTLMENDRRVMESGRTEVIEERVPTPGGNRLFLSTKTPYRDSSGNILGVIGIARDITERKKEEEELLKLNRALRAISDSNQVMMRSTDELQLLRDVCRIVVEDCGYSMVWVGYAEEDEGKTVRVVAHAGFEEGYLQNVTWADTERGSGPAGTAIRTGQMSISRDILNDPLFTPWREEARKRGYASVISLPLKSEGKVFGTITLYSGQPDPFSEDEVKLLEELSGDLEYGISAIRLHIAKTEAEEKIKENEERLELALKAGHAGSFDWDAKQGVYLWSDQLLAMYGLRRDEIKDYYKDWIVSVVPEDREAVVKDVRRAIRETGEFASEFRIRRHDTGEIRWTEGHAQVFFDAEGKSSRIIGINVDITERKKAEQALRESEQKLRLFIEHAPTAIAMFDRNMMYIAASSRWLTDYGLEDQNIIGRSHYEIFPEIPERWKEIHRRCLAGAIERCDEDPFPRLDGKIDWVHWEVLPWYEYNGDIGGVIMFTEVITERKLAKEALKESEERYRITLENMPDAVCIQSVKDARYLFANKAFYRMTGYSEDEIVGKTPFDAGLPVGFEDQENYMKCVLESTNSHRLGILHRMKDGTILNTLVSCNIVYYKGEDCSVVVIADITDFKRSEDEKKRLEIQLSQAQKMEALGTLAGGITHDFNNILTAIMGYTEIARMNIGAPEKVDKNLENAMKSCRRARDLVSQILSFSRHAGGEFAFINLNYTIEETLNMLRAMIPMSIEIRRNLVSPGKVKADPSQINQMMINLCINAAQAMGEIGGILEVGLEEVHVGEDAVHALELNPGPYLKLTVSDTGRGMTPKLMERIFEPYFTTKGKGGGIGLGLSIVHGIVKRHGGAITCQSIPGKGTTFELYLPEAVEEEVVAKGIEVEIPTGTERILFVDDEKALVEVAENLLESLGYKVSALTSSVAALDLFKKDPDQFDLVVTDMTMPEMTGDKLAQQILQIRPDIPVIMYTGYSEYITEKRAKRIGIRKFILKPFEIEDLAKSIRKELDKR